MIDVELQSQKAKNMHRSIRIALRVQNGNCYVSVYGTMRFLDDQQLMRHDLEQPVGRFLVGDEEIRESQAYSSCEPGIGRPGKIPCELPYSRQKLTTPLPKLAVGESGIPSTYPL